MITAERTSAPCKMPDSSPHVFRSACHDSRYLSLLRAVHRAHARTRFRLLAHAATGARADGHDLRIGGGTRIDADGMVAARRRLCARLGGALDGTRSRSERQTRRTAPSTQLTSAL